MHDIDPIVLVRFTTFDSAKANQTALHLTPRHYSSDFLQNIINMPAGPTIYSQRNSHTSDKYPIEVEQLET